MNKYEENVYKNLFEYPTKKIVELELKNEELEKENQQLKKNRDKAMEYLKSLKNYRFEFTFDSVDRHEIVGCEKNFVRDLINILKGDSDE